MIKEAYVSFETAKLLKKKGFDEPCEGTYRKTYNVETDEILDLPELHKSGVLELTNTKISNDEYFHNVYCSAPTQQMALTYLRIKKHIDIFLYLYYKDFYGELIYGVTIYDHGCQLIIPNMFSKKPEELVDNALKYVLENVI